MELRFSPLFSGSSGNCVFVGTEREGFLIDAGVSGKRILGALQEMGIDPRILRAVLITHEHTDHTSGVGVIARKLGLSVYATAGTWEGISYPNRPGELRIGEIPAAKRRVIERGETFTLCGIDVTPFATPHDAKESCGFLMELGASRFALATDIGKPRESWKKYVRGADAVMLESNYEPDMLMAGPYSYELKQRIASAHGHLSNDDAAETAVELVKSGTRTIILSHLSKENNVPQLAYAASEWALNQAGCTPGEYVQLGVALRDGPTGLFAIDV